MEQKRLAVLSALLENSRQSIAQIAKKPYLTKDIVQYQIKKLEQEGIIQKYITRIQQQYLYQGTAHCLFQVEDLTKLCAEKEINWFATTCGEYNVICTIPFTSLLQLQNTLNSYLKKYDITRQSIFLYTEELVFDRRRLLNPKAKIEQNLPSFTNQNISLSESDSQLLQKMAENARIQITDLAADLNLNPDTIRKRIQALEKKGIIAGYTTKVDFAKLGYTAYEVYMHTNELSSKIKTIVQSIPNIVYTATSIGEYNLICSIYCTTKEEFARILHQLKIDIGSSKEKVHIIIDELKETYVSN